MTNICPDVYHFRTFDDVLDILEVVCAQHPQFHSVELGLSELMLNAIEHGNLEISFEEKSEALETGAIIDVIEERLCAETFKSRKARLEVLDYPDETVAIISDDGPGFDWRSFLDRDLAETTGLNGRGLVMSMGIFKTMNYIGNGNKVVVAVDKEAGEKPVPAVPWGAAQAGRADEMLDVSRLKALCDDFHDGALIRELVTEFYLSVETQLRQIHDHLGREDFDGLYKSANALKGVSLNIGATEMLDLSVRLEKASREGNVEAVHGLFKQAGKAFERVCERLDGFLSDAA